MYIVDRLMKDKRLTMVDVGRLVTEMHAEINELEARLRTLREAAGRPESSTRSLRAVGSAKSAVVSRRATPGLTKSRRLQGEYMGLIRHVRGADRARIKKLAREQGREAAISAMRASPSR
jgi:hypothetical protein